MEFGFKIKNDLLMPDGIFRAVTGNVNSYTCHFEFPECPDNFLWMCVFRQKDAVYQQVIEDGVCTIPREVLEKAEPVSVGCYATSTSGDFVRISTNWVSLTLSDGAYSEASSPKTPTRDVWEDLVFQKLPYIGENGYWFVYYPDSCSYQDSGILAKGYTPQKGVDYWTESDISDLSKTLLGGLIFSISEDGIVTVSKED